MSKTIVSAAGEALPAARSAAPHLEQKRISTLPPPSEADAFAFGGHRGERFVTPLQDERGDHHGIPPVAKTGDQRILSLFRQWCVAVAEWDKMEDGDESDASIRTWLAIEDAIDECPCDGAVGLATKLFLWLRIKYPAWAPEPYVRLDAEYRSPPLLSLYHDVARFVPEIAELTAAITHEDADLIDAEIEVERTRRLSLDRVREVSSPRLLVETQERLATALATIATCPAKTERGRAIKARYRGAGQ